MRAYRILLLAATLALLLAAPTAFAMSNGAPQLNCVACHMGADKNPMDFVIEGLPKTVEPGKEYKITIKITKGPESKGAAYGGFAVAVTAGQLKVVDEKNTLLTTISIGDQQVPVITHTKEGSMKREWSIVWVAPQDCKGPIQFNVSVLAANGDGSPMGDAYKSETLILECKGATPTPITTTTVITETYTTRVPTTTYITETYQASNPALAAGVAIALFIIVVAGYMLATRGKA